MTAGEADDGGGAADDPPERTLQARVQLRWTIPVLIATIVVGVGGAVLSFRVDPVPTWVGIVGAGVVLLLGAAWVPLRYRLWTFQVGEEDLFLKRGVLIYRETVVPYVRVQHVDTQRDPIDRALGLSSLVVYTAGSRGADVTIPGLTPDEATELQRRLKALAIDAEEGEGL